MYMRAFAAWTEEEIVQQAVGQTPWGYNIVLLDKQDARELRLAYAGHLRDSPRSTSGGEGSRRPTKPWHTFPHGAQAAARRWDRAFFIFFADRAPERLQKKP
jgi:hypothetical protein